MKGVRVPLIPAQRLNPPAGDMTQQTRYAEAGSINIEDQTERSSSPEVRDSQRREKGPVQRDPRTLVSGL